MPIAMATVQSEGLYALLRKLGVERSEHAFSAADIFTKPLDVYHSHLATLLLQLADCDPQAAYGSIQESNDLSLGDLEIIIPKLRLKGSKPKDLAIEWAYKFPETSLFDAPADDGIYLRLFLTPNTLARILLPYITDRGTSYGIPFPSHDAGRENILVEFSSPNIGKEFDGNHLRSTIIGASIAAMCEAMGWDVCRMIFLGDWGKHIGLLAVGWSKFGSSETFQSDPLRHLLDVYTKVDELLEAEKKGAIEESDLSAHQDNLPPVGQTSIAAEQDAWLKNLEEGDTDAVALWTRFRDACTGVYPDLYAQLGVKFDDYSGESEVDQASISEVEVVLKEKGIYENVDGAWVIDFQKHGCKGLPTVKARHPNGTTSYLLRDVAAVLQRRSKYDFDKMIYVVSAKQDTHFKEVFKTLELMGDEYHEIAKRLQHMNFGKLQGLSPFTGSSGLLLSDIIQQCQQTIREGLDSNTDEKLLVRYRAESGSRLQNVNDLARLAVTSQELSSAKRSNTLNFVLGADEKIATQLDSYPGLVLQHWLEKLRGKSPDPDVSRKALGDEESDYSIFEQEEAYADMLKLLARYPNVVAHSFEKLEPSIVLSYLLQIVEALPAITDENDCVSDAGEADMNTEIDENTTGAGDEATPDAETEDLASSEKAEQSQHPLVSVLYDCVRTVLENGMNFIGLSPIKHGQNSRDAGIGAQLKELSLKVNGISEEEEQPITEPVRGASGITTTSSANASEPNRESAATINFDQSRECSDTSAPTERNAHEGPTDTPTSTEAVHATALAVCPPEIKEEIEDGAGDSAASEPVPQDIACISSEAVKFGHQTVVNSAPSAPKTLEPINSPLDAEPAQLNGL